MPRSFVGPLLLAGASAPVLGFARAVGVVSTSADAQMLVRAVLAALTWASLVHFGRRVLTQRARTIFWLLCATQFHLVFWGSRTTPNGLAFPLVTYGLAEVLGGRAAAGLALLTITALVLRLELVALTGAAFIYAWLGRRISFAGAAAVGMCAALAAAALTVAVDTYFWSPVERMPLPPITRNLVWPELSAVLFNVVDGRSSEWGVRRSLPGLTAAALLDKRAAKAALVLTPAARSRHWHAAHAGGTRDCDYARCAAQSCTAQRVAVHCLHAATVERCKRDRSGTVDSARHAASRRISRVHRHVHSCIAAPPLGELVQLSRRRRVV